MVSEHEILKEEDGLKVTLTRDEYPDEPYDCGQCPIVRIDRRYSRADVEHVMVGDRPTDRDDAIEDALERCHGDWRLFEKYLRAYHGVTKVIQYGPNQATDYTYFAYDTPEWVTSIGFDDKIAPRSKYDAEKSVNMNEWIAYLENEVYTYDIERRVDIREIKTRIKNEDPATIRTTQSEFAEWEHVDSCGGYYGYDYARQEALDAFKWQQENKG